MKAGAVEEDRQIFRVAYEYEAARAADFSECVKSTRVSNVGGPSLVRRRVFPSEKRGKNGANDGVD